MASLPRSISAFEPRLRLIVLAGEWSAEEAHVPERAHGTCTPRGPLCTAVQVLIELQVLICQHSQEGDSFVAFCTLCAVHFPAQRPARTMHVAG